MSNIHLQKGKGAILNLPDKRDVKYSAVRGRADLPDKYFTDIGHLPVEDQKRIGSCVGQAEGKVIEYFANADTQKLYKISNRFIYGESKKVDGIPNQQGTYPRVTAKILKKIGACSEFYLEDNNNLSHKKFVSYRATSEMLADAKTRKVKGYAFPDPFAFDMRQAIFQDELVTVTLPVGDWGSLPVQPAPNEYGYHRVVLFGYEVAVNRGKQDVRFWFRNSWGKRWGENGNGWFWFSDYKGQIFDLIVYTEIPIDVLEDAKKKTEEQYMFTKDLEYGDRGVEVVKLQERLEKETDLHGKPCFRGGKKYPRYGNLTREAVERYQCANKIVCGGTQELTGYGRLGPKTRASLNQGKQEKAEQLKPAVAWRRDVLIKIMRALGKPVKATEPQRRTFKQQADLYASGRTKPGPILTNAKAGWSFHNYGVAVDFVFLKADGGITYKGDWELLGKVGKALGFEWGGDWESFPDRPHFQYTAGYSIEDFFSGTIDESKFQLQANKANMQITNKLSKKTKSTLIDFTSFALPVLVAVLSTPEWLALVESINNRLIEAGASAALVAFLGVLVSRVWKQVLNQMKMTKYNKEYSKQMMTSVASGGAPVSMPEEPELY